MNSKTPMSISATGRRRSKNPLACSRIRVGWRRSASRYWHSPSGVEVSRARACVRTSGSLSTYMMRAAGLMRCATSWVLSPVGRPVPMSRNWSMPCLIGEVPDGAGEERPGFPREGDHLGHELHRLVSHFPVDGVVVLAAVQVVPDARGVRNGGVERGLVAAHRVVLSCWVGGLVR